MLLIAKNQAALKFTTFTFRVLIASIQRVESGIRYIDHMALDYEKGSKSFCSTFSNSSLSSMHARRCNVIEKHYHMNVVQ